MHVKGHQYEGLLKFIHFVESDMHVKIHIKDYVGFIFVERSSIMP